MTELALVIPIVMAMALVVVDLGRALDASIVVTHATRDAARAGMDYQVTTDAARTSAAQAAATAAFSELSASDVTVSSCSSDTYMVTVTYSYSPITPLVGSFTIARALSARCGNA